SQAALTRSIWSAPRGSADSSERQPSSLSTIGRSSAGVAVTVTGGDFAQTATSRAVAHNASFRLIGSPPLSLGLPRGFLARRRGPDLPLGPVAAPVVHEPAHQAHDRSEPQVEQRTHSTRPSSNVAPAPTSAASTSATIRPWVRALRMP